MRLIDADVLMKLLQKERDSIDSMFENTPSYCWQRKNELVRVMQIVAKMLTHEKEN